FVAGCGGKGGGARAPLVTYSGPAGPPPAPPAPSADAPRAGGPVPRASRPARLGGTRPTAAEDRPVVPPGSARSGRPPLPPVVRAARQCRSEDHPTGPLPLVHALHSPGKLVDAIPRNGWTPSIGTGGRHQSESVDAITRCAHERHHPRKRRPAITTAMD